MAINMSEAFDASMEVPLVIHAKRPGTYDEFNSWIPGSVVKTNIKGVITAGNKFSQFSEGLAILIEDGGRRISDYRSLYIDTARYGISLGDILEYKGSHYNVLQQSDESHFNFNGFLLEKSENWTPTTALPLATPNREDVKVVQSMVDLMVGIPKFSYPARQNNTGFDQPKPTGEFAHIRLLEEYQEGIPIATVLSQTDTTTTLRSRGLARLRFRIGVVEATGIPSSKIMNGWTSEGMKALMISSGFGFTRCRPLSNEDAKLEKEWEYRTGFSVEFSVTRTFDETVDNINSIQLTGEVISDTGDTIPTGGTNLLIDNT